MPGVSRPVPATSLSSARTRGWAATVGAVAHRESLDPAVAEVRLAVRRALTGMAAGRTVVVALSGGADSLALAAAAAFEAPRLGLRVASVTVDHGLQPGSADAAAAAAERARALGIEARVVRVDVGDERRA